MLAQIESSMCQVLGWWPRWVVGLSSCLVGGGHDRGEPHVLVGTLLIKSHSSPVGESGGRGRQVILNAIPTWDASRFRGQIPAQACWSVEEVSG